MEVYFLGRAPYRQTWDLQERLRSRVLQGGPETLLLCEHPPILTLGRGATPTDILADTRLLAAQGIDVERSSRGGQVTYHGPGQLVVYPIVRLRHGIVAHVQWLAGAAIELAAGLGLSAHYDRKRVGVWLGTSKLAAIGVHVARRVTIHGMALNVTCQATQPFAQRWFVPCGDREGRAISLQEALTAPGPALVPPSSLPPSPSSLSVETLAEKLAALLLRHAGKPPCVAARRSVALLSQSLFVE